MSTLRTLCMHGVAKSMGSHASMLVVHSPCMTRGSMTLLRALVTAITLTAGEERCLSEWMPGPRRARITTCSSQAWRNRWHSSAVLDTSRQRKSWSHPTLGTRSVFHSSIRHRLRLWAALSVSACSSCGSWMGAADGVSPTAHLSVEPRRALQSMRWHKLVRGRESGGRTRLFSCSFLRCRGGS